MAQWFTKLDPSDPKYSEVRAVLDDWLESFDSSKFNSLAKVWILKDPEARRSSEDGGRRTQTTVELPTTHLFYHPILSLLDRHGRPVKRRDILDGVADALGLSEEQRSRLANDRIPSHEYRSGWSLSVLKKAGLLANPVVGFWTLTDAGRRLLLQHPSSLPLDEIERINRVWWVKKDTNDIDIVAGTGQGRGLTAEQRKAVEEWAMLAAERYLTEKKWNWKDTSKHEPFDYKATKAGREIIVEVKGTTGSANSILLTANEVETQRLWHPNSALIVLHSIELDRLASPPRTSGGTLLVRMDWRIDEQDLEVTAYEYVLRSD